MFQHEDGWKLFFVLVVNNQTNCVHISMMAHLSYLVIELINQLLKLCNP